MYIYISWDLEATGYSIVCVSHMGKHINKVKAFSKNSIRKIIINWRISFFFRNQHIFAINIWFQKLRNVSPYILNV